MKVTLDSKGFAVFELAFHESHYAKSCGARWSAATRQWKVKVTRLVASAIVASFPSEHTDPAIARMAGTNGGAIPPVKPDAISDGIRTVTLRDRQMEGVMKAWPHRGFAFLWVMGAGKTLSTIALANARFTAGLINRLVIVCPTSIKGVWGKEIERYSTVNWDVATLESGKKPKWKWVEGPQVLIVGVEALSAGGAFSIVDEFMSKGNCMVVVDESSTIKNHSATRSERVAKIGENAAFRLILSGTSVTQGVQDLFSQFFFVDPCIIGELSFYSFRNKYCVMGGFEQRKIIGYRQVPTLLDRIRPYSDTILKGEMGLPAKVYMTRTVKASPEQVRASKELIKDMETILGDKELTAKNSLEVLLRLQQIAGGYDHEGMPLLPNPKMLELMQVLGETQGKVIIWARYLAEVAGITTVLEKEWPDSVVSMTGEVAPATRQLLVDEFQASATLRFFVANQQTAGKGLTITAATTSIYYSNTFSLEDRLQSEDRNHRIGQESEVVYIDLISNLKVDNLVASAIENKRSLAAYVGDTLRLQDLA